MDKLNDAVVSGLDVLAQDLVPESREALLHNELAGFLQTYGLEDVLKALRNATFECVEGSEINDCDARLFRQLCGALTEVLRSARAVK